MKSATCECGHQETGASDKDVMTKIESHMRNEHGDKSNREIKKMLKAAEATMTDSAAGETT